MAIAKICGIETEYGIVMRGTDDPNPIAASSILITSYLNDIAEAPGTPGPAPKVDWDFEDEQPGTDARGWSPLEAMAPEVETNLVNAVLTNGARYYVDHAHPECSTPECADARSVVVFDRAAERILQRSMAAANRSLPPGQEIVIYKNNSDGKGNSYGCHENYLMDREVPFGRIVSQVTPHFVTRQIFCGAGKVGCEAGLGPDEVPFQISQRADFFEEEVGLETTLKRPIVNTRDEPHADASKYRRLHVIIGDANLSEVATFLKVGTTALVLAMIEDDVLPRQFVFATPVPSLRAVSYDLGLSTPLALADGTTVTALEVQWELYARARKYADDGGLEAVGADVGAEVLRRWEAVLTGLESDPMALAGQLDWVAKYRLVDAYRQRHELAWGDARLAALDLQYHDLRPDRSLAARVGLERLTTDQEVDAAMTEPPTDTRAYFRGKCLQKYADDVVAANWDSMVFDIGSEPLRRVPMMEPSRGTEAHVGSVIRDSDTSAELLERLGS
ncbi:depupylase/deamidase Dop [Rhabdothermincola salaria]|uniref:depupylase/deamidase Dop n=1 Tax=Rhabdothermincola salaria TaxID=2903142 RepID=UPI001E5B3945|nr:depupylase/deamidase Dop [Rhabdothermincola salaria]MCD9623068.1 proteasome accessory factor PafA2 [Rhabdothermincola salaria]